MILFPKKIAYIFVPLLFRLLSFTRKFPIAINADACTVIYQSNKRNLLWLQVYGLVSRSILLQENYIALLFVLALETRISITVNQ